MKNKHMEEVYDLVVGTVLQNGTRKRVFLGTDGFYVHYKSPTSKTTTKVRISNFRKWLRDAVIIEKS